MEEARKFKQPMSKQAPKVRAKNFREVARGYREEQALKEASRCLQCKKPLCVKGCPVEIDIPAFIEKIMEEDYLAIFSSLR